MAISGGYQALQDLDALTFNEPKRRFPRSGLLGFRAFNLTDVVSARVRGVIHTMQIGKAPLKQEVQALEELTVDPAVPTLSVMAGFFMTHSGLKEWISIQVEQYSFSSLALKSTKLQLQLTTILPLVCLGHGFLKTSWAGTWLMLLQSMGWDDTRNYLLPAYSEQKGGWLDRRMSKEIEAFQEALTCCWRC